MQPAPTHASKSGTLRMALLVAISALALALLYHFSAVDFLRSGGATELLRSLGPKAPIAYVLLMGVLMTLWVPGTLIVLVGTAVFSPNEALLLNYAGSLTAALFGFVTARLVGGDAFQQIITRRAPTLLRFQRKLASEGFLTIFYLRLVPTPFNAISYLAGLSPVSVSTYLGATALAILPGSFAFTTLLGAGLEVLKTHSLQPLFSARPVAGVVVFIAAVLLPPRIKARFFPSMPDPDSSGSEGP